MLKLYTQQQQRKESDQYHGKVCKRLQKWADHDCRQRQTTVSNQQSTLSPFTLDHVTEDYVSGIIVATLQEEILVYTVCISTVHYYPIGR